MNKIYLVKWFNSYPFIEEYNSNEIDLEQIHFKSWDEAYSYAEDYVNEDIRGLQTSLAALRQKRQEDIK